MDKKSPPFYLYLNIFALFFTTFIEAWYGFSNLGNLKLSVDAIVPFGTQGLALYKFILVVYERKKYGANLEQLNAYFKSGKIIHKLNYHHLLAFICYMLLYYMFCNRKKSCMQRFVL